MLYTATYDVLLVSEGKVGQEQLKVNKNKKAGGVVWRGPNNYRDNV